MSTSWLGWVLAAPSRPAWINHYFLVVAVVVVLVVGWWGCRRQRWFWESRVKGNKIEKNRGCGGWMVSMLLKGMRLFHSTNQTNTLFFITVVSLITFVIHAYKSLSNVLTSRYLVSLGLLSTDSLRLAITTIFQKQDLIVVVCWYFNILIYMLVLILNMCRDPTSWLLKGVSKSHMPLTSQIQVINTI